MEEENYFLKYILSKSIKSMVREIFKALKVDSRKVDILSLVREGCQKKNQNVNFFQISVDPPSFQIETF